MIFPSIRLQNLFIDYIFAPINLLQSPIFRGPGPQDACPEGRTSRFVKESTRRSSPEKAAMGSIYMTSLPEMQNKADMIME